MLKQGEPKGAGFLLSKIPTCKPEQTTVRSGEARQSSQAGGDFSFKIYKFMVMVILILGCTSFAQAQQPPENLWKGLIAEDVAGGYKGMYAVACCVRNRIDSGMNHGLVAMRRKDLDRFVKREGKDAESMAKDIVRKVFRDRSPDVTRGATHYEAVEKYGLPRWALGMDRTVKIGEHTFFKKRRKV
jgi:hypothetical protein